MKTVAMEDTALTAKDLAAMAKKEPVILTRKGNPLVAIKNVSGSDWEAVSLANNPKFIALVEASRRAYRERGGIGLSDLRRELGLRKKLRTAVRPQGKKKG